jgi:prepilin-type N-terminal cleavage/methylation domain-containing protein
VTSDIRQSQRGLTLIELVVAISIVGILATQGLPALQTSVTNSRLSSAAQALASTAQLARDEAIKRNETVRLSSDGNTLYVARAVNSDNSQTIITVPLSRPAATPAFALDYSSAGLTLPFGTQHKVPVAMGMSGCGEDLRYPTVILSAGGPVRLCPTGVCN